MRPLPGCLSLALLAHLSPALATAGSTDATFTVVCGAKPGERQTCAANTTAGISLRRSLGPADCELGRTWGYDPTSIWVADGCSAEFEIQQPRSTFGTYTPLAGFKVADTEHGDLNIRLYAYIRYLDQQALDDAYTDAFGRTSHVQQRHDIQLNKVQIYTFGWIMSRKLNYTAYVWTSNTSLGQTSQLVVAGNLTFTISDQLTIGAGVNGLPGVRSTSGTFPFWLSIDARSIADEYFRPSYTTGIFAQGKLAHGVAYHAMLGNNLSQFGIDAGQLDPGLDTLSGALAWMPTTGEFGRGFGDFEAHDKVATRVAVHGTRSRETRQGQPSTDAFDNVQIRVSDGSVIFSSELFAPDVQIEDATYKMLAIEGGVKYRGMSVELEHYRRFVGDFEVRGTGVLPFERLHDTGFQIQMSAMALPRQLQVYGGGSKVFGGYGHPSDWRIGATYYPWKNEVVRWNYEFAHFTRSPVGALSLPYAVGSSGPVFQSNFMVWF